MGPIAAAIAVVAKVAAAKTIAGFLVRTALTIASSALLRSLTPKPKTGGAVTATGVEQRRQIGENTPRAIALGWTIVAGSEGALWASGDADDNRFNTRVITVSDWPCTLQKVWVDGRALTFEGDINTGWFACNEYRSKTGAARLWMRFLKGDWEQPIDATLVSYAAANGSWGNDDRLRGVSALLIRREYDADAFPAGAPDNGSLRVEVKDAPVYDWRDNTQVLTNVRTWKPSENPVVLCENALCLLRAPSQFSPGSTAPLVGPGMDFARRPLSKLTAMANICDELVGSVRRYRAGGVVGADMSGRDIIARFAAACGGQWVSSGEGGYLRPGHVPTPAMEVPAGALAATEADTFDPWARPDATINTLIGSYPEPSNAWEIVPLPPATDAAWVTRDGGVRSANEDLSFVPYREQAWRLVIRKVRAAQLQGTRQFTGPHWLVELEPGDVVTAPDLGLPYSTTTWWMVNSTTMLPRSEGVRAALSLSQIDAAIDDAPPALGAPAAFTPRAVSRALLAPALTVVQRVTVTVDGNQQPEIVVTLPDTSPQGLASVELRGPGSSLAALPTTGVRRTADLSRGQPYVFAVQPGWYQYRSRGRDTSGALGPPSAWVDLAQVRSIANTLNLIPGSGPVYVEGNPAASWLGIIGDRRWVAVPITDGSEGTARWDFAFNDATNPASPWHEIWSPIQPINPDVAVSASVFFAKYDTWTAGDIGAAIQFLDENEIAILPTQVVGSWESGDATGLPAGVRKVTLENLITPSAARYFSWGYAVARAQGSGSAGAWRAMLNYGATVLPWMEGPLPDDSGAIVGVNLFEQGTGAIIPPANVYNNQQTYADIIDAKPPVNATPGSYRGTYASNTAAIESGAQRGDSWSLLSGATIGWTVDTGDFELVAAPPGTQLGARATGSGAIVDTTWAPLVTRTISLSSGQIYLNGTSVTPLTATGTGTSAFVVRVRYGSTVVFSYGPFDGIVAGVIAPNGWAFANAVIANSVSFYGGGTDVWVLEAQRSSGTGAIATSSAALDVSSITYYDPSEDLR